MSEEMLLERGDAYFCSQVSMEIEEQLAGTAPHVATWLLLEYDGGWGKAAFDESGIPDEVKNAIQVFLAQVPDHKLLLIRRKSGGDKGIRFYFGQVLENNPQPEMKQLDLDAYEDILALDLTDFENFPGETVSDPFMLVCTNGKKDQCCAKFGFPLYESLARQTDYDVWESSHVGQHRFAPNVLVFPQAVYYGRLGTEKLSGFIEDIKSEKLNLDTLRGMTAYPKNVQAAVCFMLEDLGINSLEGIEFVTIETLGDGKSAIELKIGSKKYLVKLIHQPGTQKMYASCTGETVVDNSSYLLASIEML